MVEKVNISNNVLDGLNLTSIDMSGGSIGVNACVDWCNIQHVANNLFFVWFFVIAFLAFNFQGFVFNANIKPSDKTIIIKVLKSVHVGFNLMGCLLFVLTIKGII